MAESIVKLLRLASVTICLIVAASFLVFAVEQTKEGSVHQQEELGAGAKAPTHAAREGTVHKALTEASNELTSPFAGIFSSSSEWATRGIRLLLTLLIYGFGLGYIARLVRVRI